MKKALFTGALIFLTILLCACGGGRVSGAKTHVVESKMYSQKEISDAINVIKKDFGENWDGCTLNEIYYAGDDYSKDHWEWAERHGGDEVLVLMSSFYVDSSGGDGSLNPDSTYNRWSWILVREDDGPWRHVDHGY